MSPSEIIRLRLLNQQIIHCRARSLGEVVGALGAMQAQDYGASLWAMALRVPGTTEAGVEAAIAAREIVRSWPMRGTLHFMAAADVRWMLELLTPRIIEGTARRRAELGLDEAILKKSRKVIQKALKGGGQITRPDLLELLEREGISTSGGRNYHIPFYLSMQRLICFGPREGKQQTFVLFDEWLPEARSLSRDEALAEVARRYFTGHGPATLKDFMWWTGLKSSEARQGLEAAKSQLVSETVDGTTYWLSAAFPSVEGLGPEAHLLPGFDEYLLGYTDRSAVLDAKHAEKIIPGGNGVFMPMLVVEGRIAGTWKRTVKKKAVAVSVLPFIKLKKSTKLEIEKAADFYGKFLGLPAELQIMPPAP
ncbi:MAG: winged helix DNA-binding domain-containing protein [Chthoniobacteraceae bacterium]